MFTRRVMLWIILAVVSFAPTITGAMPVFRGARYLPYAVLLFSIYAFSFRKSNKFKRVALVILSIFFALTVGDLAARPLIPFILEPRPTAHDVSACAQSTGG